MKKVIVVDWLDMYGGAERVIKSLSNIYSFDRCYTLTDVMSKANKDVLFSGKNIVVEQTFLKHSGLKFRYLFPFFHAALNSIKIAKDTKLIISSSHAIAKGVKKSSENQIHICYFQARNQKYLWEDYNLYFGKAKFLISPLKKKLRSMDVLAAQQPDFIISNSIFVQNWVKKTYNRESVVIYPPVDISQFHLINQKEDYFVAVGRMEPYKRFDIIIEAFKKTDKKLIMIGNGSQFEILKKNASENVKFTGFLSSEKVFEYISKAKGFIHAGIEDFGIAPIEAQACGTPVIAYGKGGILETIIENETGIFFKEHNSESLSEALCEFDKIKFDYSVVRKNAERFTVANFENKFQNFVQMKLNNVCE